MKRIAVTRTTLLVSTIAFMLIVTTLAYYWLFIDNGPATRRSFHLDLDAARTAARLIPGRCANTH